MQQKDTYSSMPQNFLFFPDQLIDFFRQSNPNNQPEQDGFRIRDAFHEDGPEEGGEGGRNHQFYA